MYENSKTIDEILIQYKKEEIYAFYWDENLSTRKLAEKINTSQPTIRKILNIMNIPRKTRADIEKQKYYPPLSKEHIEKIANANRGKKHKYKLGKNPKDKRISKKCDFCGKENLFSPHRTRKQKTFFCHRGCHKEWKKINAPKGEECSNYVAIKCNCAWCDKELIKTPKYIEKRKYGPFCSTNCQSNFRSKFIVGEENPNYKGGDIEYYGPTWSFARRQTREKYNNTCQRCGRHADEVRLNTAVHHIKPFRDFGVEKHKEANDLNNLICYCNNCHKKVEFDPLNNFSYPFSI